MGSCPRGGGVISRQKYLKLDKECFKFFWTANFNILKKKLRQSIFFNAKKYTHLKIVEDFQKNYSYE